MRNMRATAIVTGLLTMLPAFCLAQPGGGSQTKSAAVNPASATQHAVRATRGVVTFVNANKLVITRSPKYGREVTFVLGPAAERVGNVKVGSTVDIRYRTEAKQQVATAVTVVHAKQAPSAQGSTAPLS